MQQSGIAPDNGKEELVLEGEGRMHMADGEEEGSKVLLSGKA